MRAISLARSRKLTKVDMSPKRPMHPSQLGTDYRYSDGHYC
jgi:hypothetical protein